ncbi:type I methionyl aminopeptidase [Desmospora profundinema]|uniref:Methionine aminopeptidase n=1 Tax=Desmospora profundinema TaxID=1571184 RepID=A0ABU1IR94_9BACL|nr:type I methionyl aminopeptidase [Desmospora profundinema]MDR6226454.1 methionyl aminopeptidase [Desmospora profundinema]
MSLIKTDDQIEAMARAGRLLAACHREIAKRIAPGVTTLEIDAWVEAFLKRHDATPEQKGYMGYPYATCASVNEVICHGMPANDPLEKGDIVTIDMVVNLDGWLADSAWTYGVGPLSPVARSLMKTTHDALQAGIRKAIPGNRVGHISHTIQTLAEKKGFSVVRQFIGHGIGRRIHEEPPVPHFGPPNSGKILKAGMVITIEPMLTTGSWQAVIDKDSWTARTRDGSLSAQYEHTVAITSNGPRILTDQNS